jgi:hypothetical protein
VREIHRLPLLVVLASILVFTNPAMVAGQGGCDCGCGNNGACYNSSQGGSEQSLWVIDAYYFLDDCDPLFGSAYSQSREDANTSNMTVPSV